MHASLPNPDQILPPLASGIRPTLIFCCSAVCFCRFLAAFRRSIIFFAPQNRSFGQTIDMKRLLLLPPLAIAVLFLAFCANNSNASSVTSPSAGNNGEGSLAYTVDGMRKVVKQPASSLYINEVSHDSGKGTAKIKVTIFPAGDLFDFVVADKDNHK
jgi:hypothetical protein